MSGLVHPFHKVPMSVTTPDTGEKSMNKVSGSCMLQGAGRKGESAQGVTLPWLPQWGAFWAERLCPHPKFTCCNFNPSVMGFGDGTFGR